MICIRKNKGQFGDNFNDVKYYVYNTKYKCVDACCDFEDAFRVFIWHLGVPAKIAFKKYKKK